MYVEYMWIVQCVQNDEQYMNIYTKAGMCPMIHYSPGVSAGIKMSDATLHDAYTHPLPARLMP